MISPKAQKLLALALCPSAHDGEWRSAAQKFIAALRTAGVQVEGLLAPPPPPIPQWSPPPYANPYEMRMPFGLHKGKRLSRVPVDYLRWLLSLTNLKSDLRGAVEVQLSKV